jgi:hypothetical protein
MAGNRHHDHDDYRIPDVSRPENRHEHRDVNLWAVYKFGIALTTLCVVALGLLYGLYVFFVQREGGPLPADQLNVDARRLPPVPRLQPAPIQDLHDMRAAEDQILNGYGWVDQAHGVAHIPIDRAIDLLAQRGVTSRPQTAQVAPRDVTVPTESSLGPKMQRPGGPLASAGGEEK